MQMGVTLRNVTKRFRSPDGEVSAVVAVNDVSLEILDGEMVTLLGPSGCGKTTTLRIIAGFEMPDAGRVVISGEDVTDRPPNRRDTAMVFQSYAIFPHLSVFENVAFGLRLRNTARGEVERRVMAMLDLVGLAGMAKRSPDQLSGGQQQRVALARAIVNEPVVLLFDEPLSNLDAKLREQMRLEIRRIQQTLGITSVYVTHDQAEAMSLSDRIVIMDKGSIAQIGAPADIYNKPASRFVAEFVGRANFIDATVVSGGGAGASGAKVLDVHGRMVEIAAESCPHSAGTRVQLLVRPETVRVLRGDAENTFPLCFEGTVARVVYMGSVAEYDVDADGMALLAVVTSPAEHGLFSVGERVQVGLPVHTAHALAAV